ncbi:MAG: acylglycerol kinase family protein, partial [Cyanobacteria bacterium HKST-UBA05]|nr:acylglycerol kinase family protein [Cyanobacteria bacterium HKST-UBA05]
MKRCLLVINPNAGGGQSVEELKRQLLAAVRPYQDLELVDLGVLVPDSVADMTDRLRSRLPVLDCVVVAGGDGTIADVINAMLEASAGRVAADRLPVLGIIPVGTGNRLANHLNLPLSFKRAWKAILMGATCPLDLGMVTVSALHGGHGGHGGDQVSRYFSLMAGAGIDAQI